jgi:hypothetical protein
MVIAVIFTWSSDKIIECVVMLILPASLSIFILIVAPGEYLSRIILTRHCITWVLFKKILLTIPWNQITKISLEPGIRTMYLTFTSGQRKIQIEPTHRISAILLQFCPDHLKESIRNPEKPFLNNY